MRKAILVVLAFLALFLGMYMYSLTDEADNTYTRFKKLRQQNCEFTAQFLSAKQCNELIAYKFKTVLIKPPYFKANENYVFFYQFDAAGAAKFEHWLKARPQAARLADDDFELFSASWPKKKVEFLPKLTRNCLDPGQSCMGRFWRMHDNDDFQRSSYIVYGDDQKYWKAVQQRPFKCAGNTAIHQQALKAYFPDLYQPQALREYHYLFCWEETRHLLRIASVMTEAYLR